MTCSPMDALHRRRGFQSQCERRHDYQRGFALVAALLAIVLIGAVVAGAMFATTEETRAGATGTARELALITAESAVASLVSQASVARPNEVGVAGVISETAQISGRPVTLYLTRVDSTLYWVVAEAAAGPLHSGARRRIGLLVTTERRLDGTISISPISERAWSELF
jgi:type II secretory pathway pseudopilin PulG